MEEPLGFWSMLCLVSESMGTSRRWSEDRPDYPAWSDDPDRPVRVIDSVGASFINVRNRGSWRRESWEMVSVPESDRKVRRAIS